MATPAPRPHDAPELGPGVAPLPARAMKGDAFDYDALTLAEQSAGIGVWSIDLTSGMVRATAQFFRIMGLKPTSEPVPVETIRALRHPEDRERVLTGFRQALDGHADAYEIEYRILRPDGGMRWIFGRGRVVRDLAGTPVRYSGVDIDITERKSAEAALAEAKAELERMNHVLEGRVRERTSQLEAEAERRVDAEARLHQAQKMEAVGQLTGGVAHDFNNILQIIVGNLEIARLTIERAGNSPESKATLLRAIETMQRASQSAKQLVHRLLAFSRRQVLEPAEIDVNALIADMSDMIARTLGETIEVTTSLAPALWRASVDRNQLESALVNLVVNARDAMAAGGQLCIETANVDQGSAASGDHRLGPGRFVMLCVRDTGCGIAQEHLHKVFEPFFTTKEAGKGSGLGLSMIYGFVQQSGGHLRIDSTPDQGTSVTMYLPALSEAGRAPAAGDQAAALHEQSLLRARSGETVLLVEDNDDVRGLGVSSLESLGYRVLHAASGAAALELLRAHADARIDLLFTDVVLPGGMSGKVLADMAILARPLLPVLYASGYSPQTRDNRIPETELLNKPYTIETLALRCRQAIDSAPTIVARS